MTRCSGIEYRKTLYYIIIRWNRRQTVFGDDRDQQKFLQLLWQDRERHGFLLYAYILMSNIHLPTKTEGIFRLLPDGHGLLKANGERAYLKKC